MKQLEFGKYKARAPEKLGELDTQQLLQLAHVFTYGLRLDDAKTYLASHWLRKIWMLNEARIQKLLPQIQHAGKDEKEPLYERLHDLRNNRVHLTDLFSWITDEQITDRWIITSLELKKYWGLKRVQFAGPSFRFSNLQFWQWCQAEMYFHKFQVKSDRDAFNRFCACIYLPIKNGSRISYSDNIIVENSHWFNQLTPVQVTAIRINYIACKAWLALNHKHVFEKPDSAEPVESIDMSELLLRTAKEQHLDEDLIAKKPLLVELKKLELAAKDAKELRETL